MYCDNCIHIYLYLEALILANPNKEKNCNSLQKLFIIFIKHENIWLSGTPLLNPYNDNCRYINPIPARVLENQDTLGGGQFDPPSKSYVLCPNMISDTSLESSCALLLESAKKFANLRKLNFLSQNPVL